MEDMLDKIALGEYTKSKILNDFYDEFIHLYEHAYENMEKVEPHKVGELCPNCGKELIYRQGRYGEFIGCSGYPSCTFIKEKEIEIPENAKDCPECGSGKLIIKKIKSRPFLGCTNYPRM